jgi:hypothetical protein
MPDDKHGRLAGATFRVFCFSMATKVNRQTSQPESNLNSGGTIFAVRKKALLEKLRIFQEDAS